MSDDQHNTRALIPTGTEFSHYRIVSRICISDQADVYLAEHTKLKCKVALKFLGEQFLFDSEAKSRFANEAKLAASLNNPNVVTIHDVDEYQGRPFISMEYVDGKSVAEIIKEEPLSVADAINITIKICEGLQAAHEKGLVHRDIKPGNIMIDEKQRIKILDFGIAKDLSSKFRTKTGTTFGTPNYMSPEQIQGKKIDQRSDFFSLGVVLYEMISGKQAFSGNYIAAITYSVLNESPTPLSSLVEGLPSELEKIVNRLLEKDPEKRYQDAAQIRDDLKKLFSDETRPITRILPKFLARQWSLAAISVIVIIAVFAVWYQADQTPLPASLSIMLAVLPFENLGSPADEYFTDGITDAIIVHLASNPSLGVISRNSSKKYKNTQKSNHQIGEELGVDYLLRGTVYWEREPGNRVRITGSLIRVSDDVNVWTDSYDKDLTKIFDLQEEVAFAVGSALNLALDTDTTAKLPLSTTANLDAYDYFLRGNEYFNKSWERTDIEIAASLYHKAVEIDTTYSDAYAMLSRTEASMFWEYYDRSEQRCLNAYAAADRSLKLRDDLPAGYLAMGYYYYHCATDYTLALQSFERGLRRDPYNSDIINGIAAIHRRQGEMEMAIGEFARALKLDPLSHLKAFDLAITYGMMRRYKETNEYLERAVLLAPDNPLIHIYRVWLPIFENGDVEAARRLLKDASKVADLTQTKYFWWLLRMLEFQNERSLSVITPATDTVAYLLFRSQENRLKGHERLERLYADSAKSVLEQKILEHPDDSRYISSLGLAWAGLRNKEQALSNAYRALKLLPFSRETFETPYLILNLAEILVIFGEYDEAVKQLETVLSIPGFASVGFLMRDPLWRPLHSHPEFQLLLKKADQSSS